MVIKITIGTIKGNAPEGFRQIQRVQDFFIGNKHAFGTKYCNNITGS